ncbi:MAG: tripartite tricarboxylate transporter substrate binding protein, partial [Variibacter sp.]|nr:tripartite tricarboxylate transporter substrate binding protein [Variibacter sp.]
ASPALVITAALRSGLSYDPRTSFEPVCQLADGPPMLAVQASSPYKTAQDLIAAARARPGELNFAAVGPGTVHHVALELFRREAALKVTYVPYPGGAPSINALLGGHVAATFANYGEMAPHIEAGTLRALATSNPKRIPALPEVPTMREVGLAFELPSWYGFVAPAATPAPALAPTVELLKAATLSPEVKPKLAALGLFPSIMCGAEFGAFLRAQFDLYSRVATEANIKVD